MKKLLLILVSFLLLFIFGCSSDDNPASNSGTAPGAPAVQVSGPSGTSTDQHALMARQYAMVVNGFASYASAYGQAGGTQNGNTWTWSATQGTFSYTMTAVKESNGSYSWKLVLNGTPQGSPDGYDNWTAMEGSTSADGKSGSWTIYQVNSTIKAAYFIFSTDANGTLTADLTAYNDRGVEEGKYVFINNTDGSGELSFYDGTVRVLKVTWIANGSGSWWTYNSTTGAETGTGTWS
jgi:hypothetical protein